MAKLPNRHPAARTGSLLLVPAPSPAATVNRRLQRRRTRARRAPWPPATVCIRRVLNTPRRPGFRSPGAGIQQAAWARRRRARRRSPAREEAQIRPADAHAPRCRRREASAGVRGRQSARRRDGYAAIAQTRDRTPPQGRPAGAGDFRDAAVVVRLCAAPRDVAPRPSRIRLRQRPVASLPGEPFSARCVRRVVSHRSDRCRITALGST